MPDLATQIRTYIDETAPPVGIEEIFTERLGDAPVQPTRQRKVRGRRAGLALPLITGRGLRTRGWRIAAAATLATVVLLGGLLALVLSQLADDESDVIQPAPETVTTAWSRVPHDEAVFGAKSEMTSVTVGGPGLVAVGLDWSIGDGIAAVWTSPDGITWSRVSNVEQVFGLMNSVTVGGPGLVAVGWDQSINAAPVWTSPDGITWSRVPHDEAVFGGEGWLEMSDVTAGGPGLVAIGVVGDGTFGADNDAAVWTSPDGITWSRVPHDEAVFGGEGVMNSVTAGGPGLVAVGRDGRNGAAVWTSPDGITWSRVPHDETVFGGGREMNSVTAGGPGLVAVGRDGRINGAAVWTSPDGITWSRVPHDEAVFGGWGVMNSVTAGGPGLVAVGGNPDGVIVAFEAAVWTSPDGFTWSRVPHDEAVFGGQRDHGMVGVAAGGARLVAVGADARRGSDDAHAAVWVLGTEE